MLQDLGTYMEALFVLTSALATDLPQQRNLANFDWPVKVIESRCTSPFHSITNKWHATELTV